MDVISHNALASLRSIVLILAGAYLGFNALVYLLQSRMVYFPSRTVTVTPESRGLPFEPVRFLAADGVALSGWYVPAEDARATVIVCHGNAGNISHRLDTIDILHGLRLNVFIFDYRGYGDSEGSPSEAGTYLDAEAARRWVVEKRGTPPGEVIVMGRSLGGSIAARLAMKHTPSLLILESSFTSFRDIGKAIHPWLPVGLLARFDYATIDYIRQVSCPVLVAHSPEDEIIPYRFGRELFEAAKEPKAFLELSGGHNDGFLVTGVGRGRLWGGGCLVLKIFTLN